jgi:hypothetical protein
MGAKINWDDLRYPAKCLLSIQAKAALAKSANEGRCPPYLQCRYAKEDTCPIDVQRDCYDRGVALEKNQRTES